MKVNREDMNGVVKQLESSISALSADNSNAVNTTMLTMQQVYL
jgi:hypothetical protein